MAQENAEPIRHPMRSSGKPATACAAIRRKRLLIVHASETEWDELATALVDQPFLLDSARSAAEAEERLQDAYYDAVLLNPDLPDRNGLAMVSEINCPVVVVSGSTENAAMLDIANSGAADFVTDKVGGNELAVRLWKIILNPPSRRSQTCYRFETFTFDSEQRTCTSHGREATLTRQESAFLQRLIEDPRRFATYAELIEHIWSGRRIETQNLRVLAAQVRRKIEQDPEQPELLLTVMGRGYRLMV